MESRLKIGLIVKPQGIKGELKVQPLTDDSCRFKKLKQVIIDEGGIEKEIHG
jgi:16S rRNA processing protein RimM